jgi:hypothetical protein
MVDPAILTLTTTVVATLAVLGGGGLTLWLWYQPSTCSCGTRRRDIDHVNAPHFCLPRETS